MNYLEVKYLKWLTIKEIRLGVKKNWEDFWNDIKEGLLTENEHDWGTITLKARGETLYCTEKDIPFNLCEVVEGQQRINTIYLFLLALAKVGKPALRNSFIKGVIFRGKNVENLIINF